jgi:cytoskeletal protein CcmA (bactofilin family)
VVIGDGTQISKTGNFSDINWKINPKFLKVEMDPSGGTSFVTMGTTRLQSVPFAYYANGVNADNVDGVLSASKGGTGVASISALKTALAIDQINNTADLAKPISTATQAALDTKVSTSTFSTTVAAKAPIDSPTFTGTVSGITKAMVGLGSVENTSDLAKPISTLTQEALDTKVSIATFTTTVAAKANVTDLAFKAPIDSPTFTGTVAGITKTMVGLGLVDNTADLAKPISTATQDALDTKVSTTTFSTTVATKANTSDLALKAPIDSPTFTGTISGITKAMVGLGSVNNTSDLAKPISTATQAVLDNKANKDSTSFSKDILINGVRVGKGPNNLENTVLGKLSFAKNTTGYSNTAVGLRSLLNNTTENYNTAIGAFALNSDSLKVGSNNVAIGLQTLRYNEAGNNNVAVGNYALYSNGVGSNNTAVGNSADISDPTLSVSNSTAIGYLARVSTSNTIQLGNADITRVNTSGTIFAGSIENTPIGTISPTLGVFTDLAINGTAFGITKAMVGLSNVVNTSDLAKPISTATQEALDTKVSSITFSTTIVTKENLANKSTATDLGGTNPSDELYPSQKAVKAYIAANNAAGGISDFSITTIKLADGNVTNDKIALGIDKSKVGLSNVENTALSSWTGSNNLSTVGTITSGTWSASTISISKGGTGSTTKNFIDLTSNQSVKGVKTFEDGIITFVAGINPTGDIVNMPNNSSLGGGNVSEWQSFTPVNTGLLYSLDINLGSPGVGNPVSTTVNLYRGEGITGELLGTLTNNSAFGPSGSVWVMYNFNSAAIKLIAGEKYTFKISTPTVTQPWIVGSENNYSGGVSSISSTYDFNFRTTIKQFSPENVLTQETANSTYLPLSGGTINGSLIGTTASFSSDVTVNGISIGAGSNNSSLNTRLGKEALYNSPGNQNTAIGNESLKNSFSGNYNTAVGSNSLLNNSGSLNSAFGMMSLSSNQSGLENTGIGGYSLYSNTSGSSNTSLGTESLYNNNGSYNTAVGFRSLLSNQSGEYNTAIGYNANVTSGSLTNTTAIGYAAEVDESNKIQLGNPSITKINTSGKYYGNGFIKSGGTSSEFLKADGTIDANSYLSTATGGTISGSITGTSINLSQNLTVNGNTTVNNIVSGNLTATNLVITNNETISGNLSVNGIATFSNSPVLTSSSASQAVFTDGNKSLISKPITGTGNVVLSSSPTIEGTISANSAVFTGTVGIGTTPNASAALDVVSTSKGFLPPRMTSTQRDAINSPSAGLLIWCSNCGNNGEIQVFNGINWTNMIGGNRSVALGETYQGGIVAYILVSGDPGFDPLIQHGLIVSTVDQSTSSGWYNGSFVSTGATSTSIGSGLTNSNAIISTQGSGSTYAAAIARAYNGGGYTDWYLPSRDEINKVFSNKSSWGGVPNYRSYWTSTQNSAVGSQAYALFTNDNSLFLYNTNNLIYVRAIRSF